MQVTVFHVDGTASQQPLAGFEPGSHWENRDVVDHLRKQEGFDFAVWSGPDTRDNRFVHVMDKQGTVRSVQIEVWETV